MQPTEQVAQATHGSTEAITTTEASTHTPMVEAAN